MSLTTSARSPGETDARPDPGQPNRRFSPGAGRRVLVAVAILGGAAFIALVLVLGVAWLAVQSSWPNRAAEGTPSIGINFDCDHAEYLLLEDPALGAAGYVPNDRPGRVDWCAARLDDLLSGLGAKDVRLSVQWATVEPEDGRFDFTLTDALLAVAERNGARVLLSVGMKAQRHPEFYLPQWLARQVSIPDGGDPSEDPLVRRRALEMVGTVVRHTALSAAVDAWQAENEPLIPSGRANGWRLSQPYVREVTATIRANDPQRRPVAENQDDHIVTRQRWRLALEDADIVALSVFPFRNYGILGRNVVADILQAAWWTPNLPDHARETRERGKRYWLTEMQAEPWAKPDVRLYGPSRVAPDFPPANLAKNIGYGRRSGASRVYLWGAEWWLFQKERQGDARYWEIARAAIAATNER